MFEYVGRRRGGRFRESWRGSVASVAVHAALVALLLWIGDSGSYLVPGSGNLLTGWGTGPDAGPAGGGGGGGELVTYIEVAPAVEVPAAQPPEVEPEVVPEEDVLVPPVPETVTQPDLSAPRVLGTEVTAAAGVSPGTGEGEGMGEGTGPGSLGGSGGGSGGGIGTGVGPGTGGGLGEGEIRPPVPTAVFLPPPAPRSLRGKTVTLRLSVDATGRVREVALDSPTGESSFESRLRRSAMDWRFEPARDGSNRAVAAETEVSFSF